jgi:hypothetical protein
MDRKKDYTRSCQFPWPCSHRDLPPLNLLQYAPKVIQHGCPFFTGLFLRFLPSRLTILPLLGCLVYHSTGTWGKYLGCSHNMLFHEFDEFAEQITGILRTGGSLGVILHTEGLHTGVTKPFECIVI